MVAGGGWKPGNSDIPSSSPCSRRWQQSASPVGRECAPPGCKWDAARPWLPHCMRGSIPSQRAHDQQRYLLEELVQVGARQPAVPVLHCGKHGAAGSRALPSESAQPRCGARHDVRHGRHSPMWPPYMISPIRYRRSSQGTCAQGRQLACGWLEMRREVSEVRAAQGPASCEARSASAPRRRQSRCAAPCWSCPGSWRPAGRSIAGRPG